MPKNHQKIILTVLSVVLLTLLCSSFSVVEGLEIGYPEIGGEAPTEETKLPEYIKYIFNFSVIIAGLLAFAVIIFGGIVYLISAGDPTKISDAKSRMFGGIVGLVLLLMTYLILTTINPELAILKEMEPLEPVNGVYLCETEDDCSLDDPDKKRHYSVETPGFRDFEPRWIKFISDTDELSSALVYDDEGFEGHIEEIPNTGAETVGSIPLTKSIDFLWDRPGIYLYEETDFEIDEKLPLHLSGSIQTLSGEWDDQAESLKFKHGSNLYGTVLFTENSYRGECSYAYFKDVKDLSSDTECEGFYLNKEHLIGKNTLSSLLLFSLEEPTGSITFYDQSNCDEETGNKKTFTATGVMLFWNLTAADCFINGEAPGECFFEGTTKQLHRNILSFRVTGNYKVILNSGQDFSGRCDASIEKQEGGNCYPFFGKHRDIYDPDPDGVKVESIIVVPGS